MKALVLNCTLTSSPESAGTELLARQLLGDLQTPGVDGELVRVIDRDVRFGVTTDEGDADAWPGARQKMLGAETLQDLDETPEETANATQMAARNAAHLARLLRSEPYPAGRR